MVGGGDVQIRVRQFEKSTKVRVKNVSVQCYIEFVVG